MNDLALFAGIGGGILGGLLVGHRPICAVEIDPYCRSVLVRSQNDGLLPPFPIWDDLRTFDGREWAGIADVVSGGFPCQNISPAGDRTGITGKESSLWFEMLRVIREVRPKYVFVENSAGLIRRGLDVVLGGLSQNGYDAEWCVLGADDAGAPHTQKIDCSNLHVRNGEFRSDEVSELFSTENAVHSIFTDIFKNTKDRNKILIFCADVAQAILFQRELQRITSDVGLITGETPAHERAELIARFQDKPTGLLQQTEPLRWLVNVNVLTTGFDAPNIDCVVLARPTMSPGLYYQCCGRALRLAPNKTDALILDYGGNIQRHGCIDAINIKTKNGGNGEALSVAKSLAIPQRITVIETAGQRFAEIIEHDFTAIPKMPQICGDCGLFVQGDCPYQVGLFGEEPACEHFVTKNVIDYEEDVPF